jgi:hypothetical protein
MLDPPEDRLIVAFDALSLIHGSNPTSFNAAELQGERS